MPKINENAQDQSTSKLQQALQQLSFTNPVFHCGVNRKVNTGGFENIDLYSGLSLPITEVALPLDDKEFISQIVEHVAELGFSIVAKETAERYNFIKDQQS